MHGKILLLATRSTSSINLSLEDSDTGSKARYWSTKKSGSERGHSSVEMRSMVESSSDQGA